MSIPQWPKYRFRRAIPRIKDCLLDLGYCATEEEVEARMAFIELCRQVVEETETIIVPARTDEILEVAKVKEG